MYLKILNEGLFDNSLNEDVLSYTKSIISELKNIKKTYYPKVEVFGVYADIKHHLINFFTKENNKPIDVTKDLTETDKSKLLKLLTKLEHRAIIGPICMYKEFLFSVDNMNSSVAETRHTTYCPDEWFSLLEK